MELRVLRYFLAVAQEESISGAAEYLHITQPTLSRQLMDLEEELGKKLFSRGGRRVALTEDGMLLWKRAGEIIDLVEKTRMEVCSSEEHVSGDVYIGCGETDAVSLLARAAGKLRSQFPDIHYHIFSGDGTDVTERLDRGLVDFGILLGRIDKSKYDCIQLPAKDVWGVLMPKDHPLAAGEFITPEELWGQPLILSRQTSSSSSLMEWLGRDVSQLNVVGTYSLIYNASLLVREGLGLALCLDKLINTTGDSPLCFRPLSPRLELDTYMVWKRFQIFSKAAEKLLEQTRAEFLGQNP